jgi:hypothetical protein
MSSPILLIDRIRFGHGDYRDPGTMAEISVELLDGRIKKFTLGISSDDDAAELHMMILEWMKKKKKFGPVYLDY